MNELHATIEVFNPDIIAITENEGRDKIDAEIGITGYNIFRKDRWIKAKGEGILAYIREAVEYKTKFQNTSGAS